MNTIYFHQTFPNQLKLSGFNHSSKKILKQQRPNSIWQDDVLADDFIEGDFKKNLIISTLNIWYQQHLIANRLQPTKLICPTHSYKN